MFVTESEKRLFALKPMNCPGHVEIFKTKTRSYKDLPLRMAEFGSCTRNEASGALHGIMRVRGFVQDDGHIFCTEEQISSEVVKFCILLKDMYKDFGFADDAIIVKFSTRPEKRVGSDESWDKSEAALEEACKAAGLAYEVQEGEGAFMDPNLNLPSSMRLDDIGNVVLFKLTTNFPVLIAYMLIILGMIMQNIRW